MSVMSVGGMCRADLCIQFFDVFCLFFCTTQVEHLVMRALSLKLIKGLIDEVDGTLDVSWVQPRVLDMAQLGKMRGKLAEWNATVDQTLVFMTNETPELFT